MPTTTAEMSTHDSWACRCAHACTTLVATSLLATAISLHAAEQASGTAFVVHAPSVNGTVDGSVQQMLPESVTLNGGAIVTGQLRVPGSPSIRVNGKPSFGGTTDASGAVTPTSHQVTLNGNSTLGSLVRRVDGHALPQVIAPLPPSGTRSVNINAVGDPVGDWSTLRNLTLNGGVGNYTVPAGAYGDFTANGGTSFTLGIVGTQQPTLYSFQRLSLGGQAQIRVVGPVIVTVANGFSANGQLGAGLNRSWLTLNIYSGGFTLNGGAALYGYVNAPNGSVTVNGDSQLVGGVTCDRLIVNGGGLLRLVEPQSLNQPPVANGDVITTDEDLPYSIVLSGSDPEGADLGFSLTSLPSHGTLSGTAANLVYSPSPDYFGSDAFSFVVDDGLAESNPATISITVEPVNDRPLATPASLTTAEDAVVEFDLHGFDVDGDVLDFQLTSQTQHGSINLVGAHVRYEPDADFNGPDGFQFTVSDGSLTSVPATVAIEVTPVNDPPEAADAGYTTLEETARTFVLYGYDRDGDAFTFSILSGPHSGTLSGVAPELTYHPNVDFAETDTLVYQVVDSGGASATGTITIAVTNLNDAPIAAALPVPLLTDEDTAAEIVLLAEDADGGPFFFTITAQPVHGTLAGGDESWTYRPDSNYFGADSFTFKATDIVGADSEPVVVPVTVSPVNDVPVAHPQTLGTDEDSTLALTLTGDDVDGDSLAFEIVGVPTLGKIEYVHAESGGAAYVYTPDPNVFGVDSFSFTAFDGTDHSAPASVQIVVKPVNDLPVALPGAAVTDEDVSVDLTLEGDDVEHDPLTWQIVIPPLHGSLTPTDPDGNGPHFNYQPTENYNGTDSFAFTVADAEGSGSEAAFALVVRAVNDVPVAKPQSITTDRNVSASFTLDATDADGDALVFDIVAGPTNGSLASDTDTLPAGPVSGLSSPNLVYIPATDFAGSDAITFRARDAESGSEEVTIPIIVIATNRPPIAESDSVAAIEDIPTPLVLGASDPDGNPLTFVITTQPAHGVLLGAGANRTYQATTDYFGSDSFQFKVNDGLLDSEIATITIDVAPIDDAPVADEQSVSLDEDSTVALHLTGHDPEGLPVTFMLPSLPTQGELVDADGVPITALTVDAIDPDFLRYVPAGDFNGDDLFTFAVSDRVNSSSPATVRLTVRPVNDAPVVEAQSVEMDEDTPISITLHATDVDSDDMAALTYTITSMPAQGTLNPTAEANVFVYVPAENATEPVSFSFAASDGKATSDSATVSISITPVNDRPIALASQQTAVPGVAILVAWSGFDVDGDVLDVKVVEVPVHGVLSGSGADLTYTADEGYRGTDRLTFVVTDGIEFSDPAVIEFTVVGALPPPPLDAGGERSVSLGVSARSHAGTVVVNNDEWTLSDTGFANAPGAANFARNLATWFKTGEHGRFLVYSSDFGMTGSALANAMRGAGHWWEVNTAAQMTLTNLLAYDAVFLDGRAAPTDVLLDYVDHGGCVYICGRGYGEDATLWNSFLANFGLKFGAANPVAAVIPITSQHPLFAEVPALFYLNGNDVELLSVPKVTNNEILHQYGAYKLISAYTTGRFSVELSGEFAGAPIGFDPLSVDFRWEVVEASGFVRLADSNSQRTRAFVDRPGTYQFRLTASNEAGASSALAIVHLDLNVPPLVSAGPDQILPEIQAPALLEGVVSDDGRGDHPPTAQWSLVAGPDGGEVVFESPQLPSTVATFNLPGRYLLSLTASDGVDETSDVVEVRVASPCTVGNGAGATAWWPFDQGANDIVGQRGMALGAGAHLADGKVLRSLSLDGYGATARATASPALDVGRGGEMTVEFWIATEENRNSSILSWSQGAGIRQVANRIYPELLDVNGARHYLDTATALVPGAWSHVAVTYSRGSGLCSVYQDGILRTSQILGSFTPATSTDLVLGFGALYGEGYFRGRIDELSIYDRVLSAGEILAIARSGAVGKCMPDDNEPPQVDAGPDQVLTSTEFPGILSGRVTDDGLPDYGTLTTRWTQISGPAAAVIAAPETIATPVVFSAAGRYLFELGATDGLSAAVPDRVEVWVGEPCVAEPAEGMVAWWPGNGSTEERIGGLTTVGESIRFEPGIVQDALSFSGNIGLMLVPASPEVDLGSSAAGFSVEFWIRPEINDGQARRVFTWMDGTSERMRFESYGSYGLVRLNRGDSSWDLTGAYPAGGWVHCAFVFDRAAGRLKVYRNGLLQSDRTVSGTFPTGGDLYFGGCPYAPSNQRFIGGLDEVSFYNRPLQPAEVFSIYDAGAAGKCLPIRNVAPVVYAGPDLTSPNAGMIVDLHGFASDDGLPDGRLTTQWRQVFGPETAMIAEAGDQSTVVQLGSVGLYGFDLIASDGYLSRTDRMQIRVGDGCVASPGSGLVAWWSANETAEDSVSGSLALNAHVPYVPGEVGPAFGFDGAGGFIRVPARPEVDLGGQPLGFSIELWVDPAINDGQVRRVVSWVDGTTERVRIESYGQYGYLRLNRGDVTWDISGVGHAAGWVHCAFVYDRPAAQLRAYRNGVLQSTWSIAGTFPTLGNVYLGGLPWAGTNTWFSGGLDELSFYNRPLSGTEIASIYNAGAAGKCSVVRNTAPIVSLTSSATGSVGTPLAIAGIAVDDGLPNPPGALTYVWSVVSGPTGVIFSDATRAETTATFADVGTYVLRLTVDDSELTGSDDITVQVSQPPPTVAMVAPVDGSTVGIELPVTLRAQSASSAGTVTHVEFFSDATKLGEATAPVTGSLDQYELTVSSGFTAGSHVLTARATDNYGGTTTSAPVTITAISVPPSVTMLTPADSATLAADFPTNLIAKASGVMGPIAKVEFFRGATKLGEVTGELVGQPGHFGFTYMPGFPAGAYTLTARATDTTGTSATSAAISISAIDAPNVPPSVYLDAPTDGARISAPVPITGLAHSLILSSWHVDCRLKANEGAPAAEWTTIASGTSNVGTPASETDPAVYGALGTFDPTLLLNGIYELQLVATDARGLSLTDGPLDVIVEGNMKIGAFTVAFEDMSVPVSGIPISIVRSYDSRDARAGDFGPGWTIAVNNLRVQKNRPLGTSWFQEQFSVGMGYAYYVAPGTDRIVTIVLPDGETHRFKGDVFVKNCTDGDTSTPCNQLPDNASYLVPAREGRYLFRPLGDTTSTLEPLDQSNALSERFWLDGTDQQDFYVGRYLDMGPDGFPEPYNPTRFRLTTKDGSVFILDERLGLLEMRDLAGNSLVLQRDAQQRVTAIASTQVAGAADEPVIRTVTIHRDSTGRVDYIEDLDGDTIDYTYDEAGRLATVTDRALNVTEFHYENPTFAHYLTRIVDPRGLPAIRCEYDENGRLVKQTDADGHETVFDRGVDATGRFEQIEDRLGNPTTYYYDDRGNITLKVDPEGARTTMSYYPDSDWTRFETDHYGNSKSFAYDSRGNVTVETLGASVADDPAAPTTGYVSRMSYNGRGSPTSLTDPDGRLQTFTYAPLTNDLVSHTTGAVAGDDAAGDHTTFTYLSDGSIDTITDAIGNVTKHIYHVPYGNADYPGAFKRVTITVSDPAGSAGSDPVNTTDTVLRTTATIYDASEKALAEIVQRTLPDGSTEEIVTRHRYDADDRLVATILPDGRVQETRYNAIGKESASVQWQSVADYESGDDSLARVTSYAYDARGNQVLVTHPDASTEATGYDAENRRLWSQDPRGARTFFEYDKVGRLTATLLPDDNDGLGAAAPEALDDPRLADNARSTTIYDLVGRVRFQVDEEGAITEYTYEDGCGCAMRRKEMIQHLESSNLVTTYLYDDAGNVRKVTDPRGNTVETQYDDQGRPTHVIYPATDEHPSTQAVTTYDALGRRVAMADQEGRITRYRYDGLGRLVEMRQYLDQALAADDSRFGLPTSDSGIVSTRYTYDEAGNQTSQTDALDRTTTYETDALGRRVKRILPKDGGEATALSEVLDYDAWGQLWHRTDFAGNTTTFEYDVLGRLRAKVADPAHPSLSYSNAPARIEFDYDIAGLREAARTYRADGTLLYSESTPRDVRGRLDYKETAGGRLDYGSYENGLLKEVVSSNPDGVNIGYRYDALNRLAFVDDLSTGAMRTTSYSYNANGSLETVTYANGVAHAYQYDTLNRLRDLSVRHLSSVIRHQDYRLRASGHRREIVETDARYALPAMRSYEYDALYRLTGETISGDAAGHDGTVTYALDKVGNRSSRVSSVPSVSSVVNQNYNARDWLDGDSYDANGNTVSSNQLATRYPLLAPVQDVYDFENRLIVRQRTDGASVNLTYDADGNRISKTILDSGGGFVRWTTYLVDTNNLTGYAQVFEERTTTFGASGEVADDITRTFTYGTDLISRSVSTSAGSSSLSFFSYDGHGSVRELTDETGAVTDRYDYDAFGVLLRHEGTSDNAYLYCGEQWDEDLQLYFLRARFMNPDSGRFWNADSFEGFNDTPLSLHRYLYANASPVDGSDPTGSTNLSELSFVQTIQGLLQGGAQVSLRIVARKAGCFAIEYAVGEAVGRGVYIFIDEFGAYVGKSKSVQRRLLQHGFEEYGKRIRAVISRISVAKNISDKQLSQIEQFVLDNVRKALGLGRNSLRRDGAGISNRINPVREFLRKTIKLC